MLSRSCRVFVLVWLAALGSSGWLTAQASDEARIQALSEEFCQAIVSGDLTALDRVFDSAAGNIYYDINEGPLVGLERLKRVWGAAIRNSRLNSFAFNDDVRIVVEGDRALQTGSWVQTQKQADGSLRQIDGRASILWRKDNGVWKVYHYHASVVPPRRQRQ